MTTRRLGILGAFALCAVASLPAQTRTFGIDEVRPGMTGVGRTVFEGDRVEEFQVHIIGVLRNVIGPRRDLVLARLEGGPLAHTGVIAGMSGSPVYVDGRLLGAVSYSLGEFSKEPIAGITPIQEMRDAAALSTPRRQAARIDLPAQLTPETLAGTLREAFAWARPFAASPNDVQLFGDGSIAPGIGTLLRPIATPLTLGGFDPRVIEPFAAAFQGQGFVPVMGAAAQLPAAEDTRSTAALRPGDPIGVSLMMGDLDLGGTGTVTEVDGDRVYAFGHPFYGLGPTQFPMTRAYVHTVLPSLTNSMKIAGTGEVIGTISQDRATTIAGTLGSGPPMIPITLTLNSERAPSRTFSMSMVNDQLLTPMLAYLAVLDTLTQYERESGVATYVLRGGAEIKGHGTLSFADLFTGDQPSASAASSVVAPINLLLRNSFEPVEFEALKLEIDASEQPRTATLERVWVEDTRPRPGDTVTLRAQLRTFRGDEIAESIELTIPPNARSSVSVMVADGLSLAQWEARELQVQPAQAHGLPQMMRVLNNTRRNNRLYVRLVTRDPGAVVRGEPLAALPASVRAVVEADRNGGNVRPLQSALFGDWEIVTDHAVIGSRTLTIPLDE